MTLRLPALLPVVALMLLAVTSQADTLRVAMTIFAESRGESFAGKSAVASVIYNRAGTAMTRNRITRDQALDRTCRRPAFSCWPRKGWPHAPDMTKPAERKAWFESYDLARQIQCGAFQPTTEASHYAERSIRNYWTARAVMIADVGAHRFYK